MELQSGLLFGVWILNFKTMIPNHYPQSYDVIDFVKDNDLNFNEGNIIKYVVRCRKKGTHLQDLQKAKDYLEREIDYLTKKELQR
jgi:hypothetical protein